MSNLDQRTYSGTAPPQATKLLQGARALQAYLDKVDASSITPPFAASTGVALDGKDLFPTAACKALDQYQLARYYVPCHLGGDLDDYGSCLQLLRTLARRDLTVAIAHAKTYLGCVSVWIAGTDEQAQHLADRVLAGVPVSWALTEREHGSDLLATELTATPTSMGFRVAGEKWLINNATRAGLVCALARTSESDGARSLSLLMIDRSAIADRYQPLPKELTHGIRGADISGFRIDRALLPESALIGKRGYGLEIVLKGLQLTRTMCAGLSLGAADHALSLVHRFASERQLYGYKLLSLPLARHTLACSIADLIVCEALSVVSARAAHTAIDEMPVWSAAVKYLVPTMTERSLRRLRRLLGARSLLTDDPQFGVFSKIEQDNALVSIFDGNTLVNLHSLVNQFNIVARAWSDPMRAKQPKYFAVDAMGAPPAVRYRDMALVSTRGIAALNTLHFLLGDTELLHNNVLNELIAEFITESERIREAIVAYRPQGLIPTPGAYDLAEKLTLALAGAACLQLWKAEVGTGPLGSSDVWLTAALARVNQLLRNDQEPARLPIDDLVDLMSDGASLSLFANASEGGRG